MNRAEFQPALHAVLNGTAATLLTFGWMAIRGGGLFAARGRDEALHKRLMLAAFCTSTVFLVSYLDYHYAVGHVEYGGTGWLKVLYLVVLVPHIVLAVLMVPAILILLVAALRGHFDRHRRLARWTLPVWLYVSMSGVVIYLMAYPFAPV